MPFSYKLFQIQPPDCINRPALGNACAQHCWYWDVWYWNLTYALHSKIISDCNSVPGCTLSPQTPHRTHDCAICKYRWTKKFWAPARKRNISRKLHLLKWKLAWQQNQTQRNHHHSGIKCLLTANSDNKEETGCLCVSRIQSLKREKGLLKYQVRLLGN